MEDDQHQLCWNSTGDEDFHTEGRWILSKSRVKLTKLSARITWYSWSDYRKFLPGQFIRIRLKIEQNCRLFLDIFSGAIMNDLFMIFTFRLKVDVKCVYQQWNWITVVNYFGTPPADWVHGYLYFEPGAWIWTKGFQRYLHIVKNWSGNFPSNSARVRALKMAFAWNFFRIFLIFLGGVCGANHLYGIYSISGLKYFL